MALAAPLLLAGVAAAAAPAAVARAWSPGPAASFSTSGLLAGVAATSASNAWAVGNTTAGGPGNKTLILRGMRAYPREPRILPRDAMSAMLGLRAVSPSSLALFC
jgi:hypothetical protein